MTKEQKELIRKELIFITKSDLKEITGWSEGVINRLFAKDMDFPAIKKGKEYVVEYGALKKYFSERRTKETERILS